MIYIVKLNFISICVFINYNFYIFVLKIILVYFYLWFGLLQGLGYLYRRQGSERGMDI